jgi:hypothetical protein
MYIPVRRSFGMVLGVFSLFGPLGAASQAQPVPTFPGLPANLNPYVNPLAGQAFGFLSGASLTPLAALGGFGYGLGVGAGYGAFYGFNAGLGYGGLGYGNLLNGGCTGCGFGGYGMYGGAGNALMSGALWGAGYGYGWGLGNVQWMMNPYQGYLQGTADITRANAQYYSTIQQAKLTRQEAIRSSLETRRAMIEEAEWERQHMPDPEKIRQRTLERELTAARVSPPPSDIWSGRALNTLLRHLIIQLGDGAKGPRIPLSEEIVKHINVKAGNSVGNVALLKNKGELDWPESLQSSDFKESREQINTLMHRAYKSVDSGNNPDPATLNDLQAQYRKMRDILKNNASKLKPDEYIEAKRYLEQIGQTLTALQDPNIGHQFSGDWKPTKARFVHELVQHMREKGLLFAPAAEEDQAAYVSLYHALAAFDAGLTRLARGNGEAAENK